MVTTTTLCLSKSKKSTMRTYIIGASAIILAVLLFTNALNYVKLILQSTSDTSVCPIYEARAPLNFESNNITVLEILRGEKYRLASVARLAGAVQVDTQVSDHLPDVRDAPDKWEQFRKFHEYLEKTFPRVYSNTEVSKVNTWGLVFNWKGSDETLKPLLLTAHQDVVPVQKDTLKDWTYPPFEGHFDGTYLYGRGSSDCKNSLIAILEALELLISEGYMPQRSVIVALGFDEEISGLKGARSIANFLEKKYGRDSIYAIIDEGPGILKDPMTGLMVAVPGTGEKGYTDISVDLLMKGGHSSVPPNHGAIGIMGELAYEIEQDQYSPLLTEENPLLHYLQCLAVNSGDKLSSLQKKTILRAGFDKIANAKVVDILSKNKLTKYLIRTSQALDKVLGGEKANALPENVALVVNHRVVIGSKVEEVEKHFVSRVVKLAQKYGLGVVAFDVPILKTKNQAGTFRVSTFGNNLEYAPVSPSSGKVWEYLASTTRHVFENLWFNNTLGYQMMTAPSLMPANTDTKYYWNLTRHIYRYSPMLGDMFLNKIHSVDERIEFDGHLQLTAWYYEYIQNVDTKDAE